jgi:hypothetical protein
VSKNYHYIRKTPKVMDTDPANTTGDYYSKTLSYQFLDEGEKYNIELFSSIRMDGSTTAPNPYGMTGATAGSDELIYTGHWGYFNQLDPVNDGKSLTLLGQDFGTKKNFADLYYMGNVGYFPYVDNPDMWKNMFDLTEVHPHEPDHKSLALYGIPGYQTNLQKILTIRYKSFLNHIQSSSSSDRLTLMRQIEKQNFIMYVLCCMAKQEQSFFALLTRYEKDNSLSLTDNYPYRYKWVKVNFNSAYNSNGPTTTNPPRAGGTYYIHQVEKWEKDGIWKSSETQDDTWAINLNERMAGLTAYNGTYFAPGWIKPSGNFKWRPVGAQGSSISTSGDIVHLVKMNMIPYTDLLLDSQNTVDKTQMGKYLYYFTVENVVDGSC